jgi:pyruvate formate lyase activating enzyme
VEFALECMKLARLASTRLESESERVSDSESRRAHEKGLKNIWVSNGFMSPETLKIIAPYLDAINIDLKSMSEKFYQEVCGAHLQPVLDNLVKLAEIYPPACPSNWRERQRVASERRRINSIHLEVTTLVIPGQNDTAEDLKNIAEFIVKKLGAKTPWHVSRFFPHYKMSDISPTPVKKIYEAVEIGKRAGLKFVYAGNTR